MGDIVFGQSTNYEHFIKKGKEIADGAANSAYSPLSFDNRIALVQSYAMLAEACKVNGARS